MRRLIFAVLLCVAAPAVAQDAPGARLTVAGTGSVATVPDMARLTLGATSRAATAAEAMAQTATAISAILDRLQAAGIVSADIQTDTVQLNPVWSDRAQSLPEPVPDGYEAANTVTVTVRDLDNLGAVIDATTQAGANTFHGLSFALQDPQPALNEARRRAVADAMARAELYAQAAGLALGPVLEIAEPGTEPPRPAFRDAMVAAMEIAPGEVATEAVIIMVFALGAP